MVADRLSFVGYSTLQIAQMAREIEALARETRVADLMLPAGFIERLPDHFLPSLQEWVAKTLVPCHERLLALRAQADECSVDLAVLGKEIQGFYRQAS